MKQLVITPFILILLLIPLFLNADDTFYKYVDKNGVIHLSNVPVDRKYEKGTAHSVKNRPPAQKNAQGAFRSQKEELANRIVDMVGNKKYTVGAVEGAADALNALTYAETGGVPIPQRPRRNYRQPEIIQPSPIIQNSFGTNVIDSRTGDYYMGTVGGGYINSRTGDFAIDAGGGIINTRTGNFHPK